MTELLNITAPIYLISFIGFLSVRFGILNSDSIRSISVYFINIAVPAALFSALATKPFETLLKPDLLLIYGIGSSAIFGLGLFVSTRFFKQPLVTASFFAMGSAFPNSLVVAFPLMTLLLGEIGTVFFANALLIENIILMPLTLFLAEIGKSEHPKPLQVFRHAIAGTLKSPIIIAILLGIASSIMHFELPEIAASSLSALAMTTKGVGLFIIGGMLCGFTYNGKVALSSSIVFIKLLISPVLTFGLCIFFNIQDPEIFFAAILLSACPTFTALVAIADRYEQGHHFTGVLLPATVISFFTLTFVIWYFH